MATATFDKVLLGHHKTAPARSGSGFFGVLFARFIAAREAEARRRIATHLAGVSDDHLASLGLSARDIEILRRGAGVNVDLAG